MQRFSRNRRGQPYPAEFIALYLLLKQRTVIKESEVQRVKGHHPRYQKSWVCFLWYRRNLTVLHPLLYQRTADLPYFEWVQSHTRWALSKNAYQSKPSPGRWRNKLYLVYTGLVVSSSRDFLLSRAEKLFVILRTRTLGVSETSSFKKD